MSELQITLGERNGDGRDHLTYVFDEKKFLDTIFMESAEQREKSLRCAMGYFGIGTDCLAKLSAQLIELAAKAAQGNGKADGPVPVSVRADSVKPRAIKWLTPQIPSGKYSTIIGHSGLGKSLLRIDLAARVTTGAPGPGSDQRSEPGDVIIIQNEDDAEDTEVPRLISAGADLSRVHFLTGIAAFDKSGVRPFTLEDVWAIERLLDTLTNPKVVEIDPVGSYCGKANAHYDSEVRGLLMPLADLARRREIAIIGNAHFNKGGGKAIDRGMGSVAWVAAARAAWGVVKDTEDPTNRLFLPIKCNLAKDTSGLSFKIIDGDGAPRLAWSDTPETRTMDDILGAQPSKRAPKTDQAIQWLKDFLALGAVAQRTVEENGGRAGHNKRTLYNAKGVIGVKSFFDSASKSWFWELPQGGEDAEF